LYAASASARPERASATSAPVSAFASTSRCAPDPAADETPCESITMIERCESVSSGGIESGGGANESPTVV